MLKSMYLFFRKLFFGDNVQYASGFWSALVRKAAKDIVTNSSGAIVEFGCSEGLFLEILSIKNPSSKITGIEISQQSAEFAKTRLAGRFTNITVLQGDAFNTKFSDGSFDVVFCVNTIVNLNDTQVEKLFLEAGRILKTNGLFIFDARNNSNLFIKLQYRFRNIYDTAKLDIVRAFDYVYIKTLLNTRGFEISHIHNIGLFSAVKLFEARKK